MKKGKMEYNWFRPAALLGSSMVLGLGLFVLLHSLTVGIPEHFANSGGKELAIAMGIFFTLCGSFMSWQAFFNLTKYYQKYKVNLDELDSYNHYDNGLLLVASNWAKMITHQHQKIFDRGYIYIAISYNRKKQITTWHFVVD